MKPLPSAKVHCGAFDGALHPRCTSAFPYIGNAPCVAPTDPEEVHDEKRLETPIKARNPVLNRHPLDHPGALKILLGHAASVALAASGPHHLVMVTRADCTAGDGTQGRMVLHCLPVSQELADAAYRVASGTHRAVRIKHPSGAASEVP